MNAETPTPQNLQAGDESPVTLEHTGNAAVLAAAERATRKIAPLWPLKHFVAVNPFLGLSDQPFEQAAAIMAKAAGARMTMPRRFYAEAWKTGRMTVADLEAAFDMGAATSPTVLAFADIEQALADSDGDEDGFEPSARACVSDTLGALTGRDWSGFVTDRLSGWAAGYFDDGQAFWHSPFAALSPYDAWRAETGIDRAFELMGARGYRKHIKALPADAESLLEQGFAELGIEGDAAIEAYSHRLLMSIGGWAAYARYKVWQAELHGGEDRALIELLAIRLGIELALRRSFKRLDGLAAAWRAAAKAYARPIQPSDDQRIDAVLQRAYEHAWQRAAIARLAEQPAEAAADTRKAVQAAFCIDVRSEVIRRALESVSDQVETIGFAGFFGFAVDYMPIGAKQSGARCPVLLKPAVHIHETVKHADASELAEHHGMVMMRKRAGSAWASFKRAAVSSFAFVETMGLAYAKNLAVNALGLAKPDGAAHACSHDHLAPDMAGMSPDARLATAEGVLKAMSLTDGFARLVVLAGHGASTVNNPHASGLDCGACGGHSGEANARIAANVLNDRCVRAGLAANGITIPEDTWFLAALHDTTTDKIGLFDLDDVPSSHKGDLKRLKRWLKQAGQRARGERAALLHDRAGNLPSRARDWSQVRPEWGLAGCAGFIAAPRAHTQGRNLEGRCFLHSYDWQQDEGFGVLELIMTAPMVVASWISLQYYGSSVDNRAFGAGNKVLHNVVGALGVLEGQGGDLRTGLPWQSVHDGDKLVHEPMRLSVMIAAPTEAMSAIIAKHDAVRALLDHGWLHLFALDDHGQVSQRYAGDLTWQPVTIATAAPVEPLAA